MRQQIIKPAHQSARKHQGERHRRPYSLRGPPAKGKQIIINNLTRLQAHPQRQDHILYRIAKNNSIAITRLTDLQFESCGKP